MADLMWRSSGGQVANVTIAGSIVYSFSSGIPVDVPAEHYASCVTALLALPDTTSAGAGNPEI